MRGNFTFKHNKGSEPVTVTGDIVKDTEKAIFVRVKIKVGRKLMDFDTWVPKSQIFANNKRLDNKFDIRMTRWIADQKGLPYAE